MKKEQKNQKDLQGLKALNDAQLLSIKGGDDDGDGEESTALVVDNGSGMMKAG